MNQAIDCEEINMSEDRIKQAESDLLLTAINRIISSEVLENTISDQLPLKNDLADSNKIYQSKASILFVDMRESTRLPEKFDTVQLVKIYRSYIRTVVQAIRYSGGVVRDFMGDGVLAVFIDNEEGISEDKAVRAARYITTAIDKLLNPVLDQTVKHRISCGIGIHTGKISLSKVGMKGKEQSDNAEDEFGIAWIGNSTNLACKFSGAVSNGKIFISSSTYSALSDIDEKEKWKRIDIAKGNNILSGYIAEQYYLQLDTEAEACIAEDGKYMMSLIEELKKEYQSQLEDISEKSLMLGKTEQRLHEQECQINVKARNVEKKEQELAFAEKIIKEKKYRFYCDVLRSGHCESAYVKAMGQSFWEENLDDAIKAGSQIGKSEYKVKQEVSYAMVSIYESLGLYAKAYEFLVHQATGYAWLNLGVVQRIVNKVKVCEGLKRAIYSRLEKNDMSPQRKEEFEKIKNWLVFEYE